MAFSFGFFNSKNLDRTYTAENFNEYLSSIICNGIQDNYGRAFDLTPKDLKLTIGSGKAWIDGHYFISDSLYTIDLSKYVDASLPRYVSIGICCNTGESFRNIGFEILPGTPATSPIIPMFAEDDYKTYLTICVVRLEADASELNVIDYRSNESYCGYVRCILGKCKVTAMISLLEEANSNIEILKNVNDELSSRISELEAKIDDYSGDIVDTGQIGDNAFYTLYSNGLLLIRGTGDTYDFDLSSNRSPFYENDSITRIVISNGISKIGDTMFYTSKNLAEVSIPNTVTKIGWASFSHSRKLTKLVIPSSVETIGTMAFSYTGIQKVVIPKTVKTLSNYAFQDCYLEEIRIEAETMGDMVFTNCMQISRVTIGSAVKKFGGSMFAYNEQINPIKYEGTIEKWNEIAKPPTWYNTKDTYMPDIECVDGKIIYDKDTKTWIEVKNNA